MSEAHPDAASQGSTVSQAKSVLRARLRQANRARSREECVEASRLLCERMRATDLWREAGSVMGFHPMPDEPDIFPLLQQALDLGKQLALPRFDPLSGTYSPVWISSLGVDLVKGAYGIGEPAPHCPAVSKSSLDLILVPGVGFDLALGRLGRGRGYYDRILSTLFGFKCGVAFDWQVESLLPKEPHDVPLDGVVTPTRWLRSMSDSEKCS